MENLNKELILCIFSTVFTGELWLNWKIKVVCLHHIHTHTIKKQNPRHTFGFHPKYFSPKQVRFSENYWHPQASCRGRKDELKSEFSAGTVVWGSVFLSPSYWVCLDGTAPSLLSWHGDNGGVLGVLYLTSHPNTAGTQDSPLLHKAALAGCICH